jgi:hypothetical protein
MRTRRQGVSPQSAINTAATTCGTYRKLRRNQQGVTCLLHTIASQGDIHKEPNLAQHTKHMRVTHSVRLWHTSLALHSLYTNTYAPSHAPNLLKEVSVHEGQGSSNRNSLSRAITVCLVIGALSEDSLTYSHLISKQRPRGPMTLGEQHPPNLQIRFTLKP